MGYSLGVFTGVYYIIEQKSVQTLNLVFTACWKPYEKKQLTLRQRNCKLNNSNSFL